MFGVHKLLRVLSLLSGLVLLSSFLADRAHAEKVIRALSAALPVSTDPVYFTSVWDSYVGVQQFEGLYTTGENGDRVLGQAERVEVSDDLLTYTIYIRQNAMWSNGDPVTAHDFVLTFRRLVDPAINRYAKPNYLISDIRNVRKILEGEAPPETIGVRALDDRTLEITLEAPMFQIPELLSNIAMSPTPSKVYAEHGEDWSLQRPQVTNGAYVLQQFDVDSEKHSGTAYLSKNESYYLSHQVFFDNVEILHDPEIDGTALLVDNRVDIVWNYSGRKLDWAVKSLGAEAVDGEQYFTIYLTFNTDKGIFKDHRLRRAFSLAIDPREVADRIDTRYSAAKSFAPPNRNAGWEPEERDYSKLSMQQRRAEGIHLLAEAGYSGANPLVVKLSLNDTELSRRLAIGIQEQWSAIGVTVETEFIPGNIYYKKLRDRNFEVARAAWIQDVPDPSDYLKLLTAWHSSNYGAWDHEAYNNLATSLQYKTKVADRVETFRQMEELITEHMPILPIAHGGETLLHRTGLRNVFLAPTVGLLLRHAREISH